CTTVVAMLAPPALTDHGTPHISSPPGAMTIPVKTVGSAANRAGANVMLDNNSATAVPTARVATDDEKRGDERRDMAGSPVFMDSLSIRVKATDLVAAPAASSHRGRWARSWRGRNGTWRPACSGC